MILVNFIMYLLNQMCIRWKKPDLTQNDYLKTFQINDYILKLKNLTKIFNKNYLDSKLFNYFP